MKTSYLISACAFYLILILMLIGIGFTIGRKYESAKNHHQFINILENEKIPPLPTKCEPYFPDFPNSEGVVIYPETGLMIIDFPDNVKVLVEKEGCK